jgi:hypothetical protein
VNIFDVIEFMDTKMYKAITMEFKPDGVRTVKVWNHDSTDCKTIEYDTRWDSQKTETRGSKS